MDAISIASSMAGLMSLAKDVLNHLSSSRGRNTPLGRIESRAHELLDEFGILFSLFYAEQTSNVDTPYPAEVARPLVELVGRLTLTLEKVKHEVTELKNKSKLRRIFVDIDSQKSRRFRDLVEQLDRGRSTLQFLLQREQVRYIQRILLADSGSRIESVTKSLNSVPPGPSKKEEEMMQSPTGISDEVILELLYDMEERNKEEKRLSKTDKGKEKIRSKVTRLPTYEVALSEGKDMRPTALHIAVTCGDVYAVKTLLLAGVGKDEQDGLGETALHKAVRAGHVNVARVLLEADVSTETIDLDGNTALHHASYMGSLELIEMLLTFRADVSSENKYGLTARQLAHTAFDKVMDGMRRWNDHEIELTQYEGELLRDALARYSKVFELLSAAELSSKLELALGEAARGGSDVSTRMMDEFVEAEMVINFPSDLAGEGLCKSLYSCANKFYELLDRLPDSGFAIGWNILPGGIPVCDVGSRDGFDIHEGQVETLWVEYEATAVPEPEDIKKIADELATLIPDYPVAVFDSGNCGIGIVIGRAFYTVADDKSSISDEVFDPEDTTKVLLDIENLDIEDDSLGLIGIQASTLMLQGISSEELEVLENIWNPSALNMDVEIVASQKSPADEKEKSAHAIHYDGDNHGMGSQGDANPNQQDENNEEHPKDDKDERNKDEDKTEGDDGGNDDKEEDSDKGPDEGDKSASSDQDTMVKRKRPKRSTSKNGRFEGSVDVTFTGSIKQRLTVLFDLEIAPTCCHDYTDCLIDLRKIVVTASRMEDMQNLEDDNLPHLFIADKVSIVVGPTGQYRSPPESVYPRPRYFVNKIVNTHDTNVEAGVELSANPKGTIKAAYGESHAKELVPIAVEVIPLFSGSGRRGDYVWIYAPRDFSTATRMEFSKDNPPTHRARYRLYDQDDWPTDLKASIKAVFFRQGKLRRVKSSLPAKIRFLGDKKTRHILLTMEARIGSEAEDRFEFPTEKKNGCKLWMGVDMTKSKLCEAKPELRSTGVVVSRLESGEITTSGSSNR